MPNDQDKHRPRTPVILSAAKDPSSIAQGLKEHRPTSAWNGCAFNKCVVAVAPLPSQSAPRPDARRAMDERSFATLRVTRRGGTRRSLGFGHWALIGHWVLVIGTLLFPTAALAQDDP